MELADKELEDLTVVGVMLNVPKREASSQEASARPAAAREMRAVGMSCMLIGEDEEKGSARQVGRVRWSLMLPMRVLCTSEKPSCRET